MNITYFTQHHSEIIPTEQLDTKLAQGEGAVWIDVNTHQPDDIAFLEQRFKFHPLAIEDVYHQEQRPKAEEFVDHLFIILNPIGTLGAEELFRELDVFVGANYLVTAHYGDEPIISTAQKRLAPERVALQVSSTYLLYVLMDTIVDGYLPILEKIEDTIEKLGNEALIKPRKSILNDIFEIKQSLNEIWWVVWPQQDIINVLTNHSLVFIDGNSHYYLRDIADHLTRIMNSIQASRDTVNSLIHIYMSSVSNQVNRAVGRITFLTIVIGILAVFSGFYGMNFNRIWPPFNAEWGVVVVLAMMIGTSIIVYLFLRWRGWLE